MPNDLQRLQAAVDDRVVYPHDGDVIFPGGPGWSPHRDAVYTRQDELGRWKTPRRRRKPAICSQCQGKIKPGSRRYAECCGRFGRDQYSLYGVIDGSLGTESTDRVDEQDRCSVAVNKDKGLKGGRGR